MVLTDFGIATVEGSSALTMTGEVVGSPEYLAPERALGRTPGPESDLWSLGVLLYAAVEGVSPFRQDTPLSTLRAVVDEELPPPSRPVPSPPSSRGCCARTRRRGCPPNGPSGSCGSVGAGGTRADTVPDASLAPTLVAHAAWIGPALAAPAPATTASDGTAPAASPRRDRHAVVALIAGLAALALALAALTYALLDREDSSKARRGGGFLRAGPRGAGTERARAPPRPPPATRARAVVPVRHHRRRSRSG
ncbi:non-specific serine/threonine protein kinase OS=Streptomyces fumanus OX=67302 GN=GCM10018772_45690 PE=4 SV=1 [Streptomyces fumanus]